MNIPLTLTYDDVLLVPLRSRVRSRSDVDTSSRITKKIKLSTPLVSANMDTVTESAMAVSMAKLGGIGVIHRFCTINKQVEEVTKVKRSQNIIIDNPFCIGPNENIFYVKEKIKKIPCSSFLVADEKNHLLGILTKRDIQFCNNGSTKVSQVMTPYKKLIVATPDIDMSAAKEILYEHRIEKLPLVEGANKIKGLITSTDIIKAETDFLATKDSRGRLCVGAAIGVKTDCLERAKAVIEAGADFLVVDIAHGHSDNEISVIETIKQEYPDVEIVGGNIATQQGALDLIKAGVDSVKVGIGGGSACITRTTAGVGIPQFSAVLSVAKVCKEHGIPVIADGGIKTAGDVAKAIAAGAQTIMVGSLFAGTDETPGNVITYRGSRFKIYRGMASLTANMVRPDKKFDEDHETITPEGIESRVPYKGPVKAIVNNLVGGLRSGMSYSDALTIPEFQKNAMFVRVTPAGIAESGNHTNEVV